MNTPTTANVIGSLLLLLAIGNMAMFIRFAISTKRVATYFSRTYCLLASALVLVFSERLHLENLALCLLGICAMLTPLSLYSFFHRRSLQAAVAMAPQVSQWLLKNFAALDGDGDGIISSGDLMSYCQNAEGNPTFDAADLRMARNAQFELCEIGHVVDMVVSSNPAVGLVVVNLYAISPSDAQSYPERIARAKALEYGS